jgi:hypothetical protein
MPKNQTRRLCRAAVTLAAAFLVYCVPPRALAQSPSLGDLARKEQERRKTQKPAGKTYTNKDLPEGAQKGTAPATGTAPSQAPAVSPGHATGHEGAAKPAEAPAGAEAAGKNDEASWRKRISDARENLRRNEVFAEALQTRINSQSTDFVNRDDPYQRAKIGEDRDKTLAELGRVKAEIAAGKKLIEDIEEEARKAGVPPGWLR